MSCHYRQVFVDTAGQLTGEVHWRVIMQDDREETKG